MKAVTWTHGGLVSPVQVQQQVFLRVVAFVPEGRVCFRSDGLRGEFLLLRAAPRCHDDGRRVPPMVGILPAQAEEVGLLLFEGREQTPGFNLNEKNEGGLVRVGSRWKRLQRGGGT